jgi:coenzyme F420-reducing hydrogenase alpha subunit
MTRKTIKVDYLARVEGEGGLKVTIEEGVVKNAQLNIFEPPRFFEAFMRGRHYTETPDIVARICGICPVAYQMSAVHALENIFGVELSGQLRALRRLLYCGEWIESHVLHIYMLHAPDFLGYEGAIDMARDHSELVRQGLEMKKIGNEILTLVGGREIHPINVRIGGFHRAPRKNELTPLVEKLKWARETAIKTVQWASTLDFPDRQRDYIFVTLRHEKEYPFNEGRIISSHGLDISANDYDVYFSEQHVKHSTALQSRLRQCGSAYLVGPLARYNLNFDQLSPLTKELAHAAGIAGSCRNPYQSILVRALEVVYAFDEALRIIHDYQQPDRSFDEVTVKAGRGFAATEAPRGLLYHRYELDQAGNILNAQIVPPTSQNQACIEEDLKEFIGGFLDLPEEQLRHRCEQTVRNYDPCISCATHFLKLEIDRV